MVNIPRALFTGRTGREPRYHEPSRSFRIGPAQANGLTPLRADEVNKLGRFDAEIHMRTSVSVLPN
jgi:hypothetical protein